MARNKPHAEAAYRVIPFDHGAFAVEVSISETIRPRSARSPQKLTLRLGSPSIGAGYSPKTSRAAGYRSSGSSGANRRGRP
jgi:hypothetical protein